MSRTRGVLKGFGYSLSANLVSLVVSLVSTLIVPKFFSSDLAGFGLFQIYMFYVSYTILAQFGWSEGIYLREGGREYRQLPKSIYSAQSLVILVSQVVIGILLFCVSSSFLGSNGSLFIAGCLSVDIVLCSWRHYFLQIMQATGRLREFSVAMIASRVSYLIVVVIFIAGGWVDWRVFVAGDVVARIIGLAYTVYYCRDLVFVRPAAVSKVWPEAKENIRSGFSLLMGSMLGLLNVGAVRFVIQQRWEPSVYGQISLVLNIVNVGLVFIGALSLAFFPVLRTMPRESLTRLLPTMDVASSLPVVLAVGLFGPAMWALTLWLPAFREGLNLLVWVIPYILFSARIQLHLTTYMKVVRLERDILYMNLAGLVASVAVVLAGAAMGSLSISVAAIVVGAIVTSAYGEARLRNELGTNTLQGLAVALVLMSVFVAGQVCLGAKYGSLVYVACVCVYCVTCRSQVLVAAKMVRER